MTAGGGRQAGRQCVCVCGRGRGSDWMEVGEVGSVCEVVGEVVCVVGVGSGAVHGAGRQAGRPREMPQGCVVTLALLSRRAGSGWCVWRRHPPISRRPSSPSPRTAAPFSPATKGGCAPKLSRAKVTLPNSPAAAGGSGGSGVAGGAGGGKERQLRGSWQAAAEARGQLGKPAPHAAQALPTLPPWPPGPAPGLSSREGSAARGPPHRGCPAAPPLLSL